MKTIIAIAVLVASIAIAQTCIVPAPVQPPKATMLTVILSQDGGACSGFASVPGGVTPTTQQIPGVAKCNTAKQIADQMAAIDNGWNDGGTP